MLSWKILSILFALMLLVGYLELADNRNNEYEFQKIISESLEQEKENLEENLKKNLEKDGYINISLGFLVRERNILAIKADKKLDSMIFKNSEERFSSHEIKVVIK